MAEAVWRSLATRKNILVALGIVVLIIGGLWLADPDAFSFGFLTKAEQSTPALPSEGSSSLPSGAEQVASLRRAIDDQRKYIESLKNELNDPNSDYHETEQEFQRLDNQRSALRRAIRDAKAMGKTAEAVRREAELQALEPRWKESRDSFDLGLTEHKGLQKGIESAARQLKESQRELTLLQNASSSDSTASADSSDSDAPAKVMETATEMSAKKTPAPSIPTTPYAIATAAAKPAAASSATNSAANAPANRVSHEVELAREEVERKAEDVKKAKKRIESIEQRIEVLKEDISEAKKLLNVRQKQVADKKEDKAELEEQLAQKMSAKAPEAEIKELTHRLKESQQDIPKTLGEVHFSANHLHMLQRQLSRLQAARVRALHDFETKKQAADAAEAKIASLQNPFRSRNIASWLRQHGPRLSLVAIGMLIFYGLSRLFGSRAIQFMAQGTSKRGTKRDREHRSTTLAGVFNSVLSVLILIGGSLMMFDAVGIPIVPLLGGAAALGLAVAFGAQNLIKDYFSGFMVLLEDQYGINDVVKIGSISGLVEHISLRATVLRDLEGTVHFIPHGTIATVSNMTHGWSRALFDIGIDYKEDADRVMKVLLDLGRELRQEPAFAALILDDPEMLGVDNLADSSVILKFFIKTRPLQQWAVKREMLRRIKKRFDELGIDIPYPHQTVHHRYDSPPPAGAAEAPPLSRVA